MDYIHISDMLGQSGLIAIFGMGIVFSFLIILVAAISLMGKIVGRFSDANNAVSVCCTANNESVTAAITAAVNEYRRN